MHPAANRVAIALVAAPFIGCSMAAKLQSSGPVARDPLHQLSIAWTAPAEVDLGGDLELSRKVHQRFERGDPILSRRFQHNFPPLLAARAVEVLPPTEGVPLLHVQRIRSKTVCDRHVCTTELMFRGNLWVENAVAWTFTATLWDENLTNEVFDRLLADIVTAMEKDGVLTP